MGRGKNAKFAWCEWPLVIVATPFAFMLAPLVWLYDRFFLSKKRG